VREGSGKVGCVGVWAGAYVSGVGREVGEVQWAHTKQPPASTSRQRTTDTQACTHTITHTDTHREDRGSPRVRMPVPTCPVLRFDGVWGV
jgi:hypothetical protein